MLLLSHINHTPEISKEFDVSSGSASALEISAKCIRENDATTARRIIAERLQTAEASKDADASENGYLLNMREGFKVALAGMYAIAQRGES